MSSSNESNLTPDEIREFQQIFKKVFEDDISLSEAHAMANQLLNLYWLLGENKNPSDDTDNLHSGKHYDTLRKHMHQEPTEKQMEALRFLRNAIVHEGYSPSVRELAKALGYKSPRTAFLILEQLMERGWIARKADGKLQLRRDLAEAEDHARTVEVPLVGNVACGVPLLAKENIEAFIPVSTRLARPGSKYFLLRAVGDSMNLAGIEDGDLVLVRQQSQADNGSKVVALIDDEATIKEFHREKEVVVLKPRSKRKAHRPIVLTENFLIQGVVVTTIPNPN